MASRNSDLHQLQARLGSRVPRIIDGKELRRAAVAVILRPTEGDLEVALIKRTESEGDPWSGHIAFPGGTSEPTDDDLLHTARRETLEEVRIDLAGSSDLLGRLDDVQAIGRGKIMRLVIAPFVFAIEGDPDFVPNEEVQEVLWAPLGPMLRRETATSFELDFQGGRYTMDGYKVGPHIVWGLTYYMLEHLFTFVDGRPAPPDPRTRVKT